MVAAVDIKSSEGRTLAITGAVAISENVSLARTLAVFNFPSAGVQASEGRIIAPVLRNSPMDVSEARVLAIVKGRIADPKVRVWTGTLDDHDFFFLRLGDDATLVYDLASEQWVDWDSTGSGAWRLNTGCNWPGAVGLADTYGSSVVAGDDTFGLLWFLDPDFPYDQNPDATRAVQQIEFERIVTGQVLATGRQYLPCYAIFVDGDNYGLVATDFTPSVRLEFSDDQGRNFQAADTLLVEPDVTINNPYAWYSLGQINSPGRIFRVIDNGLFTRIDSMSMNDDG